MYNIVLYILKSSSYSLWEKKPSYLGYLFIYLFLRLIVGEEEINFKTKI